MRAVGGRNIAIREVFPVMQPAGISDANVRDKVYADSSRRYCYITIPDNVMTIRASSILLLFLLIRVPSLSAQDLPPIDLSYSSCVTDRYGERVIAYFGKQRRVRIHRLSNVSPWVKRALLATEDRDFYEHDGVSIKSLGRALWETLKGNTQGGSTLTMQLARNLFLSHERTITRKLAEIDYARELEERYSKNEIMLLYMNTVYLGDGNYGIWTAARQYFQKDPSQLSITESALLVGLLKGPELYNPVKHPERAVSRRNEVLHNLVETDHLNEAEFKKLSKHPVGLKTVEPIGRHFSAWVRREAAGILSGLGRSLGSGQYRIVSTLDPRIQEAAEKSVQRQWNDLPESMTDAQIGLVCMENSTGAVAALIGGNPSSRGGDLDHVLQIRRQPGSSFKPFLYASLLEQGYTLATPVMDAPLVVDSGKAWEWRPRNDSDTSSGGAVTMKYGITHSLNLVAAHAMTELSDPADVAAFALRCGINSELPIVPSLALGTGEVTPLEMTRGYGVFASGGLRVRAFPILSIMTTDGRVLFEETVDSARVLDPETAYLMTDALQAVVDSGTGRSVRRFYTGPAAGKTGTTQRSTDAWFVGFTPHYSMAVWMGFDDARRKLHGVYRYGGTACAPIWGRVAAVAEREYLTDSLFFTRPEHIIDVELCEESGQLAVEDCPRRGLYPVNELLIPGECDLHGGSWLFGW